jgi:hypothetical protein
MKKLILLISSALWLQICSAQNSLVKIWDYRFGGTYYDFLSCFQQTRDGGYILGGYSLSGISGDKTLPLAGIWDYWIVKLDSLGIKQWESDLGGLDNDEMHSIEQTADGGYILGGSSISGIGGDKTQATQGQYDYWIVKTDSLGVKEWDKDFGGIANDFLYSIRQTDDRGYILGGYSLSAAGGDKTQNTVGPAEDYWIVKTDSLGVKQWDKDYGGFLDEKLFCIQQTMDKGYIMGGWSGSGISGDKTQPLWGPTGDHDYWIVKTDLVGNLQWEKAYGGTNNDELYSLQQTFDRGYILGGLSESGISGDKTQATWGGADYWIIKIDMNGNMAWDRDIGGTDMEPEFGNIAQTSDKGYVMAGRSASNMGGDKTENNLGIVQTWAVKTDSLGAIQWDKTLLVNGKVIHGYAIETREGCYAMTDFNDGIIGGDKSQDSWNISDDYWIIKFCDTAVATSVNDVVQKDGFSIYPNPAHNTLNVKCRIKNAELRIYDVTGRIVHQQILTSSHQQINASFSPGIYLVRVTAGEKVWTEKLVVE